MYKRQVLCTKGDKMCERGRALSVFATIYLLYFSCLQVILYDIYIAKTIATVSYTHLDVYKRQVMG